MGGDLYQSHPGARVHCCRCSLPGLTGFTAYRREGTGTSRHKPAVNEPGAHYMACRLAR
jgi:hypothetical protein